MLGHAKYSLKSLTVQDTHAMNVERIVGSTAHKWGSDLELYALRCYDLLALLDLGSSSSAL